MPAVTPESEHRQPPPGWLLSPNRETRTACPTRPMERYVTTSTIGLLAGLLLGIAAATGGFFGFLIALVLGVVGYLVGGHYDGEIDLSKFLGGKKRA